MLSKFALSSNVTRGTPAVLNLQKIFRLTSHQTALCKHQPILFSSSRQYSETRTNYVPSDLTSAAASSTPSSLPPGFLPPPPDAVPSTEVLNALGEPTLSSLGLASYWPTGLIQSLLETIHVYGDLPWYSSVICLTACIRLLAIPLTISQLRNAANLSNHLPTLQSLQTQQVEAARSGDRGKYEKTSKEMMEYMARNNVNPLKMMTRPLLLAPVFLSVYWGLHGMTNLPVQSMAAGGCLWFTNLTVPDPLYILPVLNAATIYLVTKTGAEGASMDSMQKPVQIMFKVLPAVVLAFTAFQPSALVLYWTTSNCISLLFAKLFRLSHLKRMLNIPDIVRHPLPKAANPNRASFSTDFHDYKQSMQLAHEIMDRQKVNALKYGEKDPVKAWVEHKAKHINIGPSVSSSTESPTNDIKSKPDPKINDSNTEYDPSKPRLTVSDFKDRPIKTNVKNDNS